MQRTKLHKTQQNILTLDGLLLCDPLEAHLSANRKESTSKYTIFIKTYARGILASIPKNMY